MNLQTSSTTVTNNFNDATRNPALFQKKFSVRYFLATRLLPRRVRKDVEYLYAFVRIPDEIVDTEYKDNLEGGLRALDLFEKEWKDTYSGIPIHNNFLIVCKTIFKKYNIPFGYSLDFLTAMKQDTSVSSYETYKELEGYMYGSAGVVGCLIYLDLQMKPYPRLCLWRMRCK
jgi:phytoene synthase